MSSFAAAAVRHLGRVKRHGSWMISSIVLLWVLERYLHLPERFPEGATDVGANVLQAFIGIYGLVLAFAVFITWGQHNDTQVAVEREAVLVGELYRLLSWFDRWPGREAAREHLRKYAHGVPGTYANGYPVGSLPEREHIEALFSALLNYRTPSPTEERLWNKALDLIHDLSQTREHRITTASLRLPWGLRWFSILGGAMVAVSCALLHVEPFGLHVFFQALLTWVVVAAVSIVLDLDDPYTGDFVVDWARFEQAAERMECLACPEHLADPDEPEDELAGLQKAGVATGLSSRR
ncbi:MAG TPA: hypothetical protein VFB81_18010 [Myxococcales bacterium]|nr:hypothetical protein [Myxococcales bacterium]